VPAATAVRGRRSRLAGPAHPLASGRRVAPCRWSPATRTWRAPAG